MLNPKYKVGDLVQTWDAVVVGLVIKVENCDSDLNLPRGFDDQYSYTIKTPKQNIMYFESELNLVS
jgi:hypothetical protein